MITILKTSLNNCELQLEFEGDTEKIKQQIDEWLDYFVKKGAKSHEAMQTQKKTKTTDTTTKTEPVQKRKSVVEQPKMNSDLLGVEDIKNLLAYVDEKKPSSHLEVYAVLALWLRDNKDLAAIGIDEIWTAYKTLQKKAPQHLMQTFRDGKAKKGYFVNAEEGKYSITPQGEMFVEYDLPRKESVSAE